MSAHAGDQLTATTNHTAVADTDPTFLAVETPAREDGSIDPAALLAAAEDVGEAVADKHGYHLVVIKSTVLPDVVEDELVPAIERRGQRIFGRALRIVLLKPLCNFGLKALEPREIFV